VKNCGLLRAARVLSGGAMTGYIHPWRDRTFTYREVARIMGFPDDWRVDSYSRTNSDAAFGKAVTVQCGRWLGGWLKRAHEGNPGKWTGTPTADRETMINISGDHKQAYSEKTGERGDFRSDASKKEMARRPA